jgi:hypothetical protein
MTDETTASGRPQYGEYATPEQQAAAMGVTYQPTPTSPPPAVVPAYGPSPTGGPVVRVQQSRRWDLFLTALLLAYGIYNVVAGLFQYSDFTGVAQTFFSSQGIGTFTSQHPGLASKLGLTINVVDVVLYVIVVVAAVTLLRRGKVAFWVPLVGGVIALIVSAVCLMTLLFSDPSFAAYLTKLGSGA